MVDAKVIVEVVTRTDTQGQITPLSLTWEDGREFTIDKVLDQRRAASLKAGGCGDRYTCSILGKTVYLYHDDKVWFMERKGV